MAKTIWRVFTWQVSTPEEVKDFTDLRQAKKYLRQFTKGDIIQIDGHEGQYKRLAYFLSNGRLYKS